MRRFGETLPTLGPAETTPSSSPEPADRTAFEPEAILKALGTNVLARGKPQEERERPASGQGAIKRRPLSAAYLPRAAETRAPARSIESALPSLDQRPAREPAERGVADELTAVRAAAEAERAEAVAKAREEEREIARQALEEEKAKWRETEAEKLAADLDAAFADLHNRICDAITLALTPVLEEAMRERAVLRFSETLQRLMGRQGSAKPLTVSGPQKLLDALMAARGGHTDGLKLVPSDDVELSATVNETTLRTTIRAWATTIAAATGPRHATK